MLQRCSLVSILSIFIFLLTCPTFTYAQKNEDTTYEDAYQQAIKYFDNQENDKGYEYLNKAIGLNPAFYDALYARSYYFMQDGEYEKAIEDYRVLTSLYADKPLLYLYMGQAYMHTENFKLAEKNYLIAYDLDSNDVDITNSLGSLYFILDLYLDALIYLNKSIEIAPNNIFAYYYRAYTYYYLGEYEKALIDISSAQKIDPKDIDTFRLRALILLAQKKYKSVISVYETLQKLNIDFDVEDFLYWGQAYFAMNKFPDAEFYLELPEEHQNTDIYHYLAKTKYKLNNSKFALEQINTALEILDTLHEDAAPLFYDRAVIKYRLRDTQGAMNDFLYANYLVPEIIKQENYQGQKLDLLADAYLMLKMDKYKKQLDSTHISGYQDRASLFITSGNTNNAIIEIRKAIQLDTTNSYSFTVLATAKAMQGKFEEALKHLDKALGLTKNQAPENNYYIKSLIYGELGQYEPAIENIRKALTINAGQTLYHVDLANFYYEIQDFEMALQSIQEAIRLEPDQIDLYNERAFYYIALDKHDEAIEDCNLILENDSENIIAFYNRGLAYRSKSEYEKALEDFKSVLRLAPDDEEVKLLILELNKLINPEEDKEK